MNRLALTCLLPTAIVLSSASGAAQTLVANDDGYGVPYATPLVVENPGVMANDTYGGSSAADAGGTVTLLTPVSFGTLECDSDPGAYDLCPDGSFTYTPNAGFEGFDSFTYEVAVGGQTAQATVTVSACTGGPTTWVCWQESAFLAKAGELGYSSFSEGFEDDAAWAGTREPLTLPSVTSHGIVWQSNHPDPPASNELTTGDGPARTGAWGLYDPDHGYATGTAAECDVNDPPTDCLFKDGFTATREGGASTLYGAGGHLSGVLQPNLVAILDGGLPIALGRLYIGGQQFFGVLDTSGFTSFRVEGIDSKVGQKRLVFGDDFVFATTPADTTPPQVTLVGSYQDTGDGELAEGEVTDVAITQLLVTFSEPLADAGGPWGADSVANPASYLLIDDGGNGFETTSCAGGVAGNDVQVSVDWVTWVTGSELTATLDVNGGSSLPAGTYRLLACGTTSLQDWSGNLLDGDGNGVGGDDFARTFTVSGTGPPTANPDVYTVARGGQLDVPAPGVLANDSGQAALTAYLVTSPSHAAAFSLLPDGSFSYTHDGLSVGSDSFSYQAYDGSTFSAAATVTLNLTAVPFTWYVSAAGSDADDCLTPASACASIGEAVIRGLDGDTISISDGTFSEHVVLAEDLTLVGSSAARTVLDGSSSGVVVTVDAGATVALADLDIVGGGIGGVSSSGLLTLTRCWIHDNGTGGAGSFGGLTNTGSAWIESSSISGNHGDTSGGIANGGQLELSNSTVHGNLAAFADGISNPAGSTLTLSWSTVAGNGAWGIRGSGAITSEASIIAAHSTANCGTAAATLGHNLEDADTCGLDPMAGDMVSTDPQLAALSFNGSATPTLALHLISPAVDAAASAACPPTDQRGVIRPADGDSDGVAVCDIGAFELDWLFADGFEAGDTSGWHASATGA